MGLSRAFGCFKDPEARRPKKQKKAGNSARNEEVRPNRVVAAAVKDAQPGIAMRQLPEQPHLPANTMIQNYESASEALGDDELEPWSMGAVKRRTLMLQAKLAEANEKKQTGDAVDGSNRRANRQTIAEENTEKNSETVETEEGKEEMSTGEPTGGGSAIHTIMISGVPATTRKEPRVALRALDEEAELRKLMEEQNALAAKGAHSSKYGGAASWDAAHSQRAAPVSQTRDTRISGWGLSGIDPSAMGQEYHDYEGRAASGVARSPVERGSYAGMYGHLKGNPRFDFMSHPAN